jgi:FkbM family methyltransferase
LLVQFFRKIVRVLWVRQYRAAFLRTRVAAATEHDRILAGLGLDTIIDIGANRGQFALCVRRLYPQAQIYSFEPLQKPADAYRRTFARDAHARLFQTAIAAESRSANMHVSRWDVSSSLLPIGPGQHANFPFSEESRQETVSLAPLSACIDGQALCGVSLLKLDVQGYELSALEGCAELLEKFHYVYVESSFVELYVGQALASEVIAHLLERGFRLICVANLEMGRARRPIQADFLFGRKPVGS